MEAFFIGLAAPWELRQFDICVLEPNFQQLMQFVKVIIPSLHFMMNHIDIQQQICFWFQKDKKKLPVTLT
jgi:hypothetical protein